MRFVNNMKSILIIFNFIQIRNAEWQIIKSNNVHEHLLVRVCVWVVNSLLLGIKFNASAYPATDYIREIFSGSILLKESKIVMHWTIVKLNK